MKSKKILKVLTVVTFVFVIMLSTFTLADVGNFNTYDRNSNEDFDFNIQFTFGSSDGNIGIFGLISTIIAIIFFIVLSITRKIKRIKDSNKNIGKTNKFAIARLKQKDENFSEEKFLIWVKDLFVKMQYAWTDRNFEVIRPYETKELFEQHSIQISEYIKNNKINVMERVSVDDASIVDYENDGLKDKVTVHLSAKMKDYIIDANTQKLLEGDKETYWSRAYKLTFIRHTSVKTDVTEDKYFSNCPNCGATIKSISSGKCKYCGTVIVTDNHDEWVLSSLEPIK